MALGARRLSEDKKTPKYINTPESLLYHKGFNLFGINLAKDHIIRADYCLIVEGYLDMMIPYQKGIKNILASLGTALTYEQIRLVSRYTRNVVLVFDSDSAGRASSLRAIDLMIEQDLSIKAVSLPSGFDPDTFVRSKGREAFLSLVNGAKDFFFYKLELLTKQFDINNPKEKSKILLDILSTLSKFNNQLIKYEYLKKLAQSLDTKEEFLLLELKKLESKPVSYRPTLESNAFVRKIDSSSEEYVVKSMLCDSSVLGIIRKALEPDEFLNPVLRAIIKESFTYWDKFGDFKPQKILSCVNDETANKISQLILEDFSVAEEALKESILKIKMNRQKLIKQSLKEKIKKAEQDRDSLRLSALISEYNRIIKSEKNH